MQMIFLLVCLCAACVSGLISSTKMALNSRPRLELRAWNKKMTCAATLVVASMLLPSPEFTPAVSASDFMSPESEGGGGRFGGEKSAKVSMDASSIQDILGKPESRNAADDRTKRDKKADDINARIRDSIGTGGSSGKFPTSANDAKLNKDRSDAAAADLQSRSSPSSSDTPPQPSYITGSGSAAPSTPGKGFQSKSGMKYFDFKEGQDGPSPRYGQLISFHYTQYYKPADPQAPLEFLDSTYSQPGKRPFLQKHGNGRIVRGLDEGIHGMKVGGRRRVIVPKNVGYTELGLGPLPSDGNRRRRLGDLLDLLNNDPPQGELVFDVELVLVREDENDQGYYDDVPVSQDEVRELVLKSFQANNADFMKRLKTTTPKELYKK